MMTNDDVFSPKLAKNFHCSFCDYKCSKKPDILKHFLTLKHQNDDKMMTNDDVFSPKLATPKKYICECGKTYAYRQGLNIHRKKCLFYNNHISPSQNNELMEYLIKENSELKSMVIDVCKQIQPIHNQITNNTVNSHNKTFNLNVFLNEQCKDAMNITDFVESLQIQLTDLENVGKLGFVQGISNIIIKNLKELDITKRPIHCTDKKREVMYIKDENKWEKETNKKDKLRKAIKTVAYKNTKMLKAFKDKYPDCVKSTSKHADKYNKLVIETMGGRGDNDSEKEDKIIQNIAKEMTIDK